MFGPAGVNDLSASPRSNAVVACPRLGGMWDRFEAFPVNKIFGFLTKFPLYQRALFIKEIVLGDLKKYSIRVFELDDSFDILERAPPTIIFIL